MGEVPLYELVIWAYARHVPTQRTHTLIIHTPHPRSYRRETRGIKRRGHSRIRTHHVRTHSRFRSVGLNKLFVKYRGTSLIRNRPPPYEHHRALGMVLL